MAMWPPAEPVQRDHYYELQVHYRVTNKEIRKAYLKLSLEHHPDKLPPNASDAKFKRVSNSLKDCSIVFTDIQRSQMLMKRLAIQTLDMYTISNTWLSGMHGPSMAKMC